MGVEAPNDPKLSDRRSGRGTCRRVERWGWSAAGAVTAEPVRCSAWFGDSGSCAEERGEYSAFWGDKERHEGVKIHVLLRFGG